MLLQKFCQTCQELQSDEKLEELWPSDARYSKSYESEENIMYSNDPSGSPYKQKPKVTRVS